MRLTAKNIGLIIVLIAGLFGSGFAWWTQQSRVADVPRVYVGLGASDTVGVGADHPISEGWVPRLHAALPPNTQLVNLGISGATLGDLVRQQLAVAVDAKPQYVSLWAGVNDLRASVPLATFAQQLDATLKPFTEQNPRPVIAVLNIPDLRHLPIFAGRPPAALDATVQSWNAAIADAAQRHGAVLVDLYARAPELAAHPEYISADGFHPSSAGYARIAEYTLSALEEHVQSPAQ